MLKVGDKVTLTHNLPYNFGTNPGDVGIIIEVKDYVHPYRVKVGDTAYLYDEDDVQKTF